jgi:hypothetical protein
MTFKGGARDGRQGAVCRLIVFGLLAVILAFQSVAGQHTGASGQMAGSERGAVLQIQADCSYSASDSNPAHGPHRHRIDCAWCVASCFVSVAAVRPSFGPARVRPETRTLLAAKDFHSARISGAPNGWETSWSAQAPPSA